MLASQTRPVLVLLVSFMLVLRAYSQSFIPGNLAVMRIGTGTETLSSSGNSLFVDQYSTGGVLVNSVTVPDNGSGALLVSGASSSEGGLTRSMDGALVILAGYSTNRGSVSGSLSSQSAAVVPRAVSSIDAFGAYHLEQASTTLYTSNNIRCAASDGTNKFWTAGSPGATFYLNPPQAPLDVQGAGGNTRQVKVVAGSLYFSTQAGTAGLYAFQGLPQTAANPVLLISTGAGSQPAGFAMNPALTIAYIADQRATGGGIQKWTNNGSGWALSYTLSTGTGAFDVAADFTGAAPVIYATTTEPSANRLVSILDTGALSIVKVLASAGANRIFRGLDLAPDLRPVIVGQPQSQTVTNGGDVTFTVHARSHYTLNYQWQKDGTNLSGATSSALSLQAVSTNAQGVYRAVVTNLYGSVSSAGASLTVDQTLFAPSITSQPSNQSAPLGGTATFSVIASGTQPLTFQWQFNGVDILNQTNANLVLINIGAAEQGTYQAHVMNLAGSTNSQSANLTVVLPPVSFVAYQSPGSLYLQNFNTLPDPGTTSVNADNPVKIGSSTYGLANPFDFTFPILPNGVDLNTGIGLGGLGLSNSMPGWYALGQIAPKFGASAGDQSTGGTVSFGSTNSVNASTDRALGLLATSSTGPTAFGLKLINQSTGTLGQITIHFTGELWRQAAVAKSLLVSYWIDPAATNDFSTNVTALLTNLDVKFPANPSATNPIPVDGTAPANQISLGTTNQPIAGWFPGTALWLSWQMTDSTGKGQGVAIDDLLFSASASQVPPPVQLSIQLLSTNVVVSWAAALSGYLLQGTSDPNLPGGWSAVSQPVFLTNGVSSVLIPLGPTNQFYRLKK